MVCTKVFQSFRGQRHKVTFRPLRLQGQNRVFPYIQRYAKCVVHTTTITHTILCGMIDVMIVYEPYMGHMITKLPTKDFIYDLSSNLRLFRSVLDMSVTFYSPIRYFLSKIIALSLLQRYWNSNIYSYKAVDLHPAPGNMTQKTRTHPTPCVYWWSHHRKCQSHWNTRELPQFHM